VRVVIHRGYLNPRQERFVLEYLKHGNGMKAAIGAGYAASSAAVQAHRLLRNETIVGKIRALQNRVQRRHENTVRETLRALQAMASADHSGSLLDLKRNLPPNKMTKDPRLAFDVLELEISVKGRVRTVKLKFRDKRAGLEMSEKRLGIFPKRPRAGR
jgi:phage terminase small subunit